MANTTITREEYMTQLREYITSEMKKLNHDDEGIGFWVQFNKDKKTEFDNQLTANGISVID